MYGSFCEVYTRKGDRRLLSVFLPIRVKILADSFLLVPFVSRVFGTYFLVLGPVWTLLYFFFYTNV